jgi:DNA-binding MarR family transcriptional regulator
MPKKDSPQKIDQPGSIPEVFHLIDKASKKLNKLQSQTLREANLTSPQYFILSLLWEKDGQPFKDLATALAYTPATVTGIVDTLERKGMVYRAPNLLDRRSQLVMLTDAGRTIQRSTPTLERIFRNCCTGFEPEERKQLSLLLEKLIRSLNIEEV